MTNNQRATNLDNDNISKSELIIKKLEENKAGYSQFTLQQKINELGSLRKGYIHYFQIKNYFGFYRQILFSVFFFLFVKIAYFVRFLEQQQ